MINGTVPKVGVVVLNWNGREDTLKCLESLGRVEYPNWDILVVDNGSEDGSVGAIRERYPAVTVIEAGSNLGFAGGNNLGIEEALRRGADFVFILNNDTVVAPDILGELVAAAQTDPRAGALAAKVYYMDDPARIWYAGACWNDMTAAFGHVGQGMLDDGAQLESIAETAYTCGCAMFIRRSAIETVGAFASEFFLLFEETDWCFRARAAGFRCLLAPGARVWHRVSASFGGQGGALYEYFWVRNRLLWAERHASVGQWIAVWLDTMGMLWPPLRVGAIVWHMLCGRLGLRRGYWGVRGAATETVRWLRDIGQRAVLRVRRQAVADYLGRRFGDCPGWIREMSAIQR
jgi:GT2 family glycosyltransferase